jgi:hypothetical protein
MTEPPTTTSSSLEMEMAALVATRRYITGEIARLEDIEDPQIRDRVRSHTDAIQLNVNGTEYREESRKVDEMIKNKMQADKYASFLESVQQIYDHISAGDIEFKYLLGCGHMPQLLLAVLDKFIENKKVMGSDHEETNTQYRVQQLKKAYAEAVKTKERLALIGVNWVLDGVGWVNIPKCQEQHSTIGELLVNEIVPKLDAHIDLLKTEMTKLGVSAPQENGEKAGGTEEEEEEMTKEESEMEVEKSEEKEEKVVPKKRKAKPKVGKRNAKKRKLSTE